MLLAPFGIILTPVCVLFRCFMFSKFPFRYIHDCQLNKITVVKSKITIIRFVDLGKTQVNGVVIKNISVQ
jgi:hypothetical protein